MIRVRMPWRRWVARHVTWVTPPAGTVAPPGRVSSVGNEPNVATNSSPSTAT